MVNVVRLLLRGLLIVRPLGLELHNLIGAAEDFHKVRHQAHDGIEHVRGDGFGSAIHLGHILIHIAQEVVHSLFTLFREFIVLGGA